MKLKLSGYSHPLIVNLGQGLGVALLAAMLSLPAYADKIVTTNGRTLEGIVCGENAFNIMMDVRGTRIPVSKERIREIVRNTPDENTRTLLDRATEAIGNQDIADARAYVEQAKTLNSQDSGLQENLVRLDKQISDMEVSGGTPEERHQRAQTLLTRAQEAYDLIKTDEGNQLLIESLRRDPTYEEAHQLMAKQLGSENPDLLLAGQYFCQVLWPDHMKADSPVIPLLPKVYANLANLFEQTGSAPKAKQYIELLRTLSDGFANHADWKNSATPEVKAILDKPVDTLLAELIQKNLNRGEYELAAAKVQGWTSPDASTDVAMLYARALAGANSFAEALKVLEAASQKFPDAVELQPHANALKLMIQARDAEKKSDTANAIGLYDQVYATRQKLAAEFGETVGQHLADLKAGQMETDPAKALSQGWKATDIAALVMRYSKEEAEKVKAARVLVSTIQGVPWQLELSWTINGIKLNLPAEVTQKAADALVKPLGVRFDQTSPFILHLAVDTKVPGNGEDIVAKLNAGQSFEPPIPVMEMAMSLDAEHQTLESLFKLSWQAKMPQPPAPNPAEATPTPEPTPAMPMPGPMTMIPNPAAAGQAPTPAAPAVPDESAKQPNPAAAAAATTATVAATTATTATLAVAATTATTGTAIAVAPTSGTTAAAPVLTSPLGLSIVSLEQVFKEIILSGKLNDYLHQDAKGFHSRLTVRQAVDILQSAAIGQEMSKEQSSRTAQ